MPWNFPFWQVIRAAAPALMAGNGVILKHASNVSACALAIADLFREAGLDENLFGVALVGSKRAGELIEHASIAAVTLTGSTEAGKSVAAHAGKLLKKTVLELGGSDPYVILEDADIAKAARLCAESRLLNAGQSCISAKRFIVVRSVLEEFEHAFVEQMRATKVGDPLAEGVKMGPLARPDLRETLQKQVDASVAAGAKLVLGGRIPEGPGAFYPPTVLTQVRPTMPVFQEETFGPVAAITAAAGETEAIALANNSVFGLGAAVFTEDLERGARLAGQELEAGSCFVNDFVKSDPRLPFGGIKQSGYGRELASFGLHEFVNIKTVKVGE
jgi:succinate-semialdehyde dehydrogenase/glutarate-semialdehyde dehydrogenase